MMNSQTQGIRVAGAIFGVMAAAQAARLIIGPRITVNDRQFPLWPSAVAVIALGGLSAWMWELAERR